MTVRVDTSGWSGDGALTARLAEVLGGVEGLAAVTIADAPASRADAGYAFLSNEVFVRMATRRVAEPARLLGVVPWTRQVVRPALTLDGLANALETVDGIGPPDYADESMLQYLRTERIVPPYQTRGVKVVELVRIYAAPLGPEVG
jgi:hypothetical protein